uniref:hypothetical protein n=1 Tax=Tessaracoccus bendigoensis TaxID=72764 RepID=UPI001C31E582
PEPTDDWGQPLNRTTWDEPPTPPTWAESPTPSTWAESPKHTDDRDQRYAVAPEPEDDPWHPHAWGPAEPRAG